MDPTKKMIVAGVLIGIIGATTWVVVSMLWKMLAYPMGRVECAAPECHTLIKVTDKNLAAATHGQVFCCHICYLNG